MHLAITYERSGTLRFSSEAVFDEKMTAEKFSEKVSRGNRLGLFVTATRLVVSEILLDLRFLAEIPHTSSIRN